MSTRKKTHKFLRADVERGLILAYYELVRGCEVSLDQPCDNIVPVVALAYKQGELNRNGFFQYLSLYGK